jgi:hypothetical protein
LNGKLIRIRKAKSASCSLYRIFGGSPNVEGLALVVRSIKVGLPESIDVPAKHLNDALEVRQAGAFLPQLKLRFPTAYRAAVGLLPTWPNRPPELAARLRACAEVDETLSLFPTLRAVGNVPHVRGHGQILVSSVSKRTVSLGVRNR